MRPAWPLPDAVEELRQVGPAANAPPIPVATPIPPAALSGAIPGAQPDARGMKP
jgi:hypothetical protein